MERNYTFYRVETLFTFLCLYPRLGNPIVSHLYITAHYIHLEEWSCSVHHFMSLLFHNLFIYGQTFMFKPHLGYYDSFCPRKLLYLSSHKKKSLLFALFLLPLRKKVHHKWCLVKILELRDHWLFWRSIC